MLLFADDVVILGESQEGIDHLFALFEEFCRGEGLTISKEKTKVMICGGGRANVMEGDKEGVVRLGSMELGVVT